MKNSFVFRRLSFVVKSFIFCVFTISIIQLLFENSTSVLSSEPQKPENFDLQTLGRLPSEGKYLSARSGNPNLGFTINTLHTGANLFSLSL